MRWWLALLMMLPACNCNGSSTPDAAPICFGSFAKVCYKLQADVPAAPAMLSGTPIDIDTDSSPMCDTHHDQVSDYCVVAGKGFSLAQQTIRAHGSKPLILLSTSTMTIDAQSVVDVSSNHLAGAQPRGAGANPTACVAGTPAGAAGGGYGGSFGGKGGDGERLTGAPTSSGVAAPALTSPPSSSMPMPLHGGCPGGTGDASGGTGGDGGGAVALIASMSIQVGGKINASGAGGHGGPATKSGGGGGGSGGMIVLDSDAGSIIVTGPLFANGGGGGQGGTGGGAPATGDDGGESLAPSTSAPGGNNTAGREGGSGGFGSGGIRLGGTNGGNTPATTNGGGGGGGGGAGFIRAPGVTTNISPPSFVP